MLHERIVEDDCYSLDTEAQGSPVAPSPLLGIDTL
jgi:hypothetical protein